MFQALHLILWDLVVQDFHLIPICPSDQENLGALDFLMSQDFLFLRLDHFYQVGPFYLALQIYPFSPILLVVLAIPGYL
jgi:hypothetical protein